MQDLPIHAIMARESTHRHLNEPKTVKVPRPRRVAARVLTRAAYRLDPQLSR